MSITRGFGSRGSENERLEDFLRRKRKRDGEGDEDEDEENKNKDPKKSRTRDFSRPASEPLNDVTNESLKPVSRKRRRGDAFGTRDEESTTQYESKKKPKLDNLFGNDTQHVDKTDRSLNSGPQKSSEGHDWGLMESLQGHNLVNPDRQRAKDDSDVSYRSLENQEGKDISADGKLDSSQQRRGFETIRRAMGIEHTDDDMRKAGVNPKGYLDARRKLHGYLEANLRGEEVSIKGYEKTREELNSMVDKLEKAGKGSHETGTPASEHRLTNLSDDSGVSVDSTHEPPRRIEFASEMRAQLLENARKRWEGDNTSDVSNFKVTPEMLKSKLEELENVAPNRRRAYDELNSIKKRLEENFKGNGDSKKSKEQKEKGQNLMGLIKKMMDMLLGVGEGQEEGEKGDLNDEEVGELRRPIRRMFDYVQADNPADSSSYDEARKELTSEPLGRSPRSAFGRLFTEKLQKSEATGAKGAKS